MLSGGRLGAARHGGGLPHVGRLPSGGGLPFNNASHASIHAVNLSSLVSCARACVETLPSSCATVGTSASRWTRSWRQSIAGCLFNSRTTKIFS